MKNVKINSRLFLANYISPAVLQSKKTGAFSMSFVNKNWLILYVFVEIWLYSSEPKLHIKL